MALRRLLPLYNIIAGRSGLTDPLNEGIGFILSACMLSGVILIKPIFEKIFESERELEESERRFRSYFELPIVGTAILDPNSRFMTANDRVCDILGASRQELLGASIWDLGWPDDLEREKKLHEAIASGRADGYALDKRFAHSISTNQGAGESAPRPIWVNQAIRGVRGSSGAIEYFVTIIQDISERKAYEEGMRGSMKEKDALLRELYHRTKNNMQVICALLSLESAGSCDPKLTEEFRLIENRIHSMPLVHEKLYQSRDLSSIDLADYIGDLAGLLVESYKLKSGTILVAMDMVPFYVPIDLAIPCGLIVNEIISNRLKHAFPGGREGTLSIRLETSSGELAELSISDDGAGLPSDFTLSSPKGMGIQTALALAEQT